MCILGSDVKKRNFYSGPFRGFLQSEKVRNVKAQWSVIITFSIWLILFDKPSLCITWSFRVFKILVIRVGVSGTCVHQFCVKARIQFSTVLEYCIESLVKAASLEKLYLFLHLFKVFNKMQQNSLSEFWGELITRFIKLLFPGKHWTVNIPNVLCTCSFISKEKLWWVYKASSSLLLELVETINL